MSTTALLVLTVKCVVIARNSNVIWQTEEYAIKDLTSETDSRTRHDSDKATNETTRVKQ
jgi:hypothetical protein